MYCSAEVIMTRNVRTVYVRLNACERDCTDDSAMWLQTSPATHPKPRTESGIIIASAPPHWHPVLVKEVVASGQGAAVSVQWMRNDSCGDASRGHLAYSPLTFRGVPQDGRDYSESRKPLVRVPDALVLVGAVAKIVSWREDTMMSSDLLQLQALLPVGLGDLGGGRSVGDV